MSDVLTLDDVEEAFGHVPGVLVDAVVDRHGPEGAARYASWHDPAMYAELVRSGDDHGVTVEMCADVISFAWVHGGVEHLTWDEWCALAGVAGYRIDNMPAPRPTAPITLYRGAPHSMRDRHPWTEEVDLAHVYASGYWAPRERGIVWRAEVDPDRIVTVASMYGGGHEFAVDTDGLVITPHELPCRCDVDLAPFAEEADRALSLHELLECERP